MRDKDLFSVVSYTKINKDNNKYIIECIDEFGNKRVVERVNQYGIVSVPKAGTQAVVLNDDINTSNAIIIAENDGVNTPRGDDVNEGDTILYTDNNSGDNVHKITLRADGNTRIQCNDTRIDIGKNNTIQIYATSGVTVTGTVNVNGDVVADGISLKTHVHGQNSGNHFGGGVDTSGPK